jgi:hypothetical protein
MCSIWHVDHFVHLLQEEVGKVPHLAIASEKEFRADAGQTEIRIPFLLLTCNPGDVVVRRRLSRTGHIVTKQPAVRVQLPSQHFRASGRTPRNVAYERREMGAGAECDTLSTPAESNTLPASGNAGADAPDGATAAVDGPEPRSCAQYCTTNVH